MKYENITEGRFLDRPNRFIAHVEIAGQTETVHVKNTGRCRELLIPGVQVFLEKSSNPARKTAYDLVCVNKRRTPRSIWTPRFPIRAAVEWVRKGGLFPEAVTIRSEKNMEIPDSIHVWNLLFAVRLWKFQMRSVCLLQIGE